MSAPELLYRHTLDTASMVAEHPPLFRNANKQIVYRIACPPGSKHAGQIVVSRWQSGPLPDRLNLSYPTILEPRTDVFDYANSDDTTSRWYLNFSHYDLFCSYGGGLFAQDEMQVAEHPALGSLRETMLARAIKPLTVENDEPTPILIRGVERRCAVATDVNSAQGRPAGLYGSRFMEAPAAAIERATRRIDPPTLSNVIAIEAPCGRGPYSRSDVVFILRTALAGFRAAVIESGTDGQEPEVEIHTGFWGCGAYGGHRVLMALLQLIAAHAAGVDRLVFHTVTADGLAPLEEARQRFENDILPLGPTLSADTLVLAILEMGFVWGESDGN
jgi:hypothetical protein